MFINGFEVKLTPGTPDHVGRTTVSSFNLTPPKLTRVPGGNKLYWNNYGLGPILVPLEVHWQQGAVECRTGVWDYFFVTLANDAQLPDMDS